MQDDTGASAEASRTAEGGRESDVGVVGAGVVGVACALALAGRGRQATGTTAKHHQVEIAHPGVPLRTGPAGTAPGRSAARHR